MNNREMKTWILAMAGILWTTVAMGQDRYFGDIDGDWDESFSWEGGVVPSAGENAFLVRPYSNMIPAMQPLLVFYQSSTDPQLNGLIIESSNWLLQNENPGFDVLSSNFEIIGGYSGSIDGLVDQIDNPNPLLRTRHVQDGGTNNVAFFLVMGQIADSGGRYDLNGGILNTGSTIAGESGLGEFIQTGGEHNVGSLVLGLDTPGSGFYMLNGGDLLVSNAFIGSAGYGEFTQGAGNHTISNNLVLGLESDSEGYYTLGVGGMLTVTGTVTVGDGGLGSFVQNSGTHTAGNVVLGAQNSGLTAMYELNGGTLNAGTSTVVGDAGSGMFTHAIGTHDTDNLTLAVQSGSTGTYTMDGAFSELNVSDTLAVGQSGTGTFTQDGGTVNVGNFLSAGELNIGDAGGIGQYTLNDGLLNVIGVGTIVPGSSFTQTGGDSQIAFLTVRRNAELYMQGGSLAAGQLDAKGNAIHTDGSVNVGVEIRVNSEYLLDASASGSDAELIVSGSGVIADGNDAIFRQRGNSLARFGELTIGSRSGDTGQYILEDGDLRVFGTHTVGLDGFGIFTQTAGTHRVDDDLVVGLRASPFFPILSAQYNLQNGTLFVEDETVIGQLTSGEFVNSGGVHLTRNLILGAETDGSVSGEGVYELSGTGRLEVSGNEVVGAHGGTGNGSEFRQLGGEHQVGIDLVIGNRSAFWHEAGMVNVGRSLVIDADFDDLGGADYLLGLSSGASDARLTIDDSLLIQWGLNRFTQFNGTSSVANDVLNDGFITQEDGDMVVFGNIDSASGDAAGTHRLSGGRLEAASHAVGNFEQTGGEQIVAGTFEVRPDMSAWISGTAVLNAGNILNSGDLTLEGFAVLNSPGGIEQFRPFGSSNVPTFNVTGTGLKTINAEIHNFPFAQVNVTDTLATFEQSVVNDVSIGGNPGVISIEGSGVDFYGTVKIESAGGGGSGFPRSYAKFSIDDSVVVFHERVTSSGQLDITNSAVYFGTDGGARNDFNDGLQHDGLLVSDQSDLYFSNIEVFEEGIIEAGAGDQFFVKGDFLNGSLEDELWDTDQSSLIFNGSGAQVFSLAGADLGTEIAGYRDNFAWGELTLGAEIDLILLDGNSIEGAALYLGVLELDEGIDTGSPFIDYILSDYNVYYDPTRPENSYLQGLTFQLNGGGMLMPSAIPEPGHGFLLFFVTIAALRRSRRA